MSHDIERLDRPVTVGEPAWHGLGVNIPHAIPLSEARRLANLAWEPETKPLFYSAGNWGTPHDVQGVPQRAIVRSDAATVLLGVVGLDYHVLTNRDFFRFVQAIADATGMALETIGSLGNGKRIWVLLRNSDGDLNIAGDATRSYVAVRTGHDGSTALSFFHTAVRIVCGNTWRSADMDAGRAIVGAEGLTRIVHSDADFDAKVEAARGAIAGQVAAAGRLRVLLSRAAARSMSDEERARFLANVWLAAQDREWKSADERDSAAAAWVAKASRHDDCEQFGLSGTLYSALQSVTYMADHNADGTLGAPGRRLLNRSTLKEEALRTAVAMLA